MSTPSCLRCDRFQVLQVSIRDRASTCPRYAMAACILPGLYIGGIDCVRNVKKIEALKISYILSVLDEEHELQPISTLTHYKRLIITDDPKSDLLSSFPTCIAFIEEGRTTGNVLVYSNAGVSRSSTIIMSYIMASEKLDCPKAFRLLKTAYKKACPNEGFQKQLKLFGAMNNVIDPEHPDFRLYNLQNLTGDRAARGVTAASMAPDPQVHGFEAYSGPVKCKKCRRVLFTERNFLEHEAGTGQLSFQHAKRSKSTKTIGRVLCSSMFSEPMEWMAEILTEHGGKICCPKCTTRLGSYSWSGSQCSCGSWLVPAFQIHKHRVDMTISETILANLIPACRITAKDSNPFPEKSSTRELQPSPTDIAAATIETDAKKLTSLEAEELQDPERHD